MRTDVKVGVVISLFIVLIAGWYYMDGDGKEEPIRLDGSGMTDAGAAAPSKAAPAGKPVKNNQRHVADAKRPAASSKRTAAKPNRPSLASVDKKAQPAARGDGKRMASASDKLTYQRPRTATGRTKTPRMAGTSNGSGQHVAKSSDSTNGLSKRGRARQSDGHRPGPRGVTGKTNARVDGTGESGKVESKAPTKPATSDKRLVDRRPKSTPKGRPIHIGRHGKATDVKASPGVKSSRSTVEAAAVDVHRVQAGDTIAALSRMYYGDEKYTQFLIEQNPAIANPSQLRLGMSVRIPALSFDRASGTADVRVVRANDKNKRLGDQKSYTVKSGDTFYGIARKTLGKAGRWQEIYELNKSRVGGDPSRLKVGQVLVLPSS